MASNDKDAIKGGSGLGRSAARLLYPLYLGQFLGVLVTLATFVVTTRLLGPAAYGLYVLAFGFANLFGSVGTFGTGTYMNRNIAKAVYENKAEKLSDAIVPAYLILVPVAIVLTIVAIAISNYVAVYFLAAHSISGLTLMLAAATIFFSMVENSSVQGLVGFTKTKLASVTSLSVDIIQLASIVFLVYLGYGVNGAVAGMLIGYVFGFLISVYFIFSSAMGYKGFSIRKPSLRTMKEALGYSAPLALNNISLRGLENASIIFMGLVGISNALIGNYGAAIKGLNLIYVGYGTMGIALLNIFTGAGTLSKKKDSNRLYNRILRYSLILTIPTAIYVGVFSKAGIALLASTKYASAPLYLSLIAVGIMINMVGYYISSLILSGGYAKNMVKYNLVSTALEFILMLILVPHFGVIGNILALYLIGSVAYDIVFIISAKKLFGIKLEYTKIAAIFLANAVLAAFLAPLTFVNYVVVELAGGMVILLLAYPPILVALKIVNAEDLATIRNSTKGMPILGSIIGAVDAYTSFFLRQVHGTK